MNQINIYKTRRLQVIFKGIERMASRNGLATLGSFYFFYFLLTVECPVEPTEFHKLSC